jgi:hypothetical protein
LFTKQYKAEVAQSSLLMRVAQQKSRHHHAADQAERERAFHRWSKARLDQIESESGDSSQNPDFSHILSELWSDHAIKTKKLQTQVVWAPGLLVHSCEKVRLADALATELRVLGDNGATHHSDN